MYDVPMLISPNNTIRLHAGCRIKLGRFKSDIWEVNYGWYSWGGNRPVCGWYLMKIDDPGTVKPLHLTDLDDIIVLEM